MIQSMVKDVLQILQMKCSKIYSVYHNIKIVIIHIKSIIVISIILFVSKCILVSEQIVPSQTKTVFTKNKEKKIN